MRAEHWQPTLVALLVALALAAYNLFSVAQIGENVAHIENASGQALSRSVTITFITDPACQGCDSAVRVATQLARQADSLGIILQRENRVAFDSPEGRALIQKYNIARIPTILLSHEAGSSQQLQNAWRAVGSIEPDGTFVLRNLQPPYRETASGRIVGVVRLIELVAPACQECFPIASVSAAFKNLGIFLASQSSIELGTPAASALIQKYNITKAPTVILEGDVRAYAGIQSALRRVGSIEADGSYVLRAPPPPFIELESNRTVGLINITHLIDPACVGCYDTSVHTDYLAANGVRIANQSFVEINSTQGAELAHRYNITLVPTILASPDIVFYATSGLEPYLAQGSIEADGWFVFRNLQIIPNATYRNLSGDRSSELDGA
ncbi:MAG: hypothetical protein QXG98_02195 [Candidatus Micrarchaeia archaeon]